MEMIASITDCGFHAHLLASLMAIKSTVYKVFPTLKRLARPYPTQIPPPELSTVNGQMKHRHTTQWIILCILHQLTDSAVQDQAELFWSVSR
jgi:hypothetical protein